MVAGALVFLVGISLLVPRVASSSPAPAPAAAGCRIVDDFSKARVGEFLPGWKVREDEGKSVYSAQQEGPLRFLRAVSRGLGIQAAREVQWDLRAWPVLAWSWRAQKFPDGADEKGGKNDSVAAVYVFVPYSKIRGPKALKYIWSERVPAGTRLESNQGLTKVVVLESGTEKQGQWVHERVNVREDYRKLFGDKDVPRPAGIGVLTDADDTGSIAEGHYARFRICRG
jgi:hypothetical protein